MAFHLWFSLAASIFFIGALATNEVRQLDAQEHLALDLLHNYVSIAKPTQNMTVFIGLNLRYLQYNEYSGILNARFWQYLSWTDSRLAWDPEDYGDVKELSVPTDRIWVPDITMYNSVVSPEKETVNAVVYSSGAIIWVLPVFVRSYCNSVPSEKSSKINQMSTINCELTFGSWTYDGHQMKLESTEWGWVFYPNVAIQGYRLINATGSVEETKYDCCPEPYYTFKINIVLAAPVRTKYSRRP